MLSEIQSNSSDFTKAYKDLVKVRANLKKSSEAYEKKLQAYNNSLANYAVVEGDMKALKKKLEEVRLLDVQSNILQQLDFVLADLRCGAQSVYKCCPS